jgi:hypothetical protein
MTAGAPTVAAAGNGAGSMQQFVRGAGLGLAGAVWLWPALAAQQSCSPTAGVAWMGAASAAGTVSHEPPASPVRTQR